MRNFLYIAGVLVAGFSAILALDAVSTANSSNLIEASVATTHIITRTIGMLIGTVMFVGGAIVHALERLEKIGLAGMPPQWQPPQGGPQMGPG